MALLLLLGSSAPQDSAGPGPAPAPADAMLLSQAVDWGIAPNKHPQAAEPLDENLRRDFFASAAPLADEGLMRRLVAGGGPQLLGLCRLTGADQPAQLDALLAAAVYTSLPSYRFGLYDGFVLEDMLRDLDSRLSPEYVPTLLRWIGDGSLEAIRLELIGMLGYAGGPQAQAWLNDYYRDALSEDLQPAEPPYSNCWNFSYGIDNTYSRTTDPALLAHSYLDLAEANVDGRQYQIFPSDMLSTFRDLYISVGEGADGTVQELLPTGLRDIYMFRELWYLFSVNRRGPLLLSVDGDLMRITFHSPAYVDGKYVDTDYHQVELSLGELRRDSDGDGLTDILEAEIFTDPQNPDSDGDGRPDRLDRLPLMDSSRWDARQRGIARAMKYMEDGRRLYGEESTPGLDRCGKPLPFSALYLDDPEGQGAAAGFDHCYTIALNPEQSQQLLAIRGPLNYFGMLQLNWVEGAAASEEVSSWRGFEGLSADAIARFRMEDCENIVLLRLVDGEYYPVYYDPSCSNVG